MEPVGQKLLVLLGFKITYVQRKALSNLQAFLGKILMDICSTYNLNQQKSTRTQRICGRLAITLRKSINSKNTWPLIILFLLQCQGIENNEIVGHLLNVISTWPFPVATLFSLRVTWLSIQLTINIRLFWNPLKGLDYILNQLVNLWIWEINPGHGYCLK